MIIFGGLFSFGIKITIKAVHYSHVDVNISYVSRTMVDFIGFALSEFIPILLWNIFKNTRDHFELYNSITGKKINQ